MNRKIATLVLIAAAAAGNAFADDITIDNTAFQSTKSRAQVQAELVQFKKGPNVWSIQYNPLARFQSAVTRQQVVADYLAERDQVAALSGEDSGSAFLLNQYAARAVPARTTVAGR